MESSIPDLVRNADGGDAAASDQLFKLLYAELHRLAEHHMRRSSAELTLGATTLVHEAYLSMAERNAAVFPDRSRFFAYASRAMRGLVIDYARRRSAKKRGRQFEITLEEGDSSSPGVIEAAAELPALGDALAELSALDPALAELVDLHFFGGFSFGEIATFRGVSERTVQRDWRKARVLLHQTLEDDTKRGS